jgi:LGFP repeat
MPEAPLPTGQGIPPAGGLHSPPGESQTLPSEESGGFTAVPHDTPVTHTVLGVSVPNALGLTASITAGSPYFKVAQLQCYNVTWTMNDPNDGELPVGHPVRPTWSPVLTLVGSSDGVTPLSVQAGQWVGLEVSVDVPQGASLPPGPFTGTAVIQGGSFQRSAALGCSYLAVDPASPIGRKWQALGGESKLGAVQTLPVTAPDGKGTIQTFANGTLYQVPVAAGAQPPVYFLSNAVYAKWLSLQGTTDATGAPVWTALGFPAGDTFATVEGGQACDFQDGVIVVRKSGQAWVVYGAIHGHYTQFGNLTDPGHQPWIGLPASDEQNVDPLDPGAGQRVSNFDGGDIYWSAATGAWEMHGAILQQWTAAGGFRPGMGLPTTDETSTPDNRGRFNRFQGGGAIYWTSGTGAHILTGPILGRWDALGGVNSYLGYPTSDVGPWAAAPPGQSGDICSFQYGQLRAASDGTVTDMPTSVTVPVNGTAGADIGNLDYSVTVTVKSNGDWSFSTHAHDNAFNGYDYQITAALTAPGGIWLGFAHSGSIAGESSTSGSSTDDHSETGNHPWIAANWTNFASSGVHLNVTLNASANGVAGFLADQAKILLEALAAAVVAGPVVGVMILIGEEAAQANLGISGAIGVIAGVAVFVLTGCPILAIAAGAAAGAVSAADIQQRQIRADEYEFANNVFHNTLPPMNQIWLTNLAGLNGRAFTVPWVDGNIYMNLGDAYDSPTTYPQNVRNYSGSYTRPGELFIHEMTHVWQIHHDPSLPVFLCDAVVAQTRYTLGGIDVYDYGPPTTSWGDYNPEAQGAIVNQWFGGNEKDPWAVPPNRVPTDNEDPSSPTFAATDPYFHYIRDIIRAGGPESASL